MNNLKFNFYYVINILYNFIFQFGGNMKKVLFGILLAFVFVSPVFSAPSISGGEGLVHVPSADLMLKGTSDFGLYTVYSKYGNDFRGQQGDILLMSNYGWTSWFELNVIIPVSLISPEIIGVTSPMIGGKFKLFSNSLISLAAQPYIKPSLTNDSLVGSGKIGYGANILAKYELTKLSFLLSLGYDEGESVSFRGNKFIQSASIKGSAGLDYSVKDNLEIFGEGIGSSNLDDGNQDLFFQVGVRYYYSPAIVATVSGGTGIPDWLKADTDIRVVTGLSYSFMSVPSNEPVVAKTGKKSSAQVVSKNSVKENSKKQVTKPKPVVKKIRVMIISSCQDLSSAKKLGDNFEKKGLEVIKPIVSSQQKVFNTTIIFGVKGQSVAFKIAKWVPGRQKLIKRVPLGYDADVVVKAGCDISKVAKEKKKPLSQMKIAVLNACQPGSMAAENVAKILLLAGFNVDRIGENDKYDHKDFTEVVFKSLYKDEAIIISKKIPGKQRLTETSSMLGDEEIAIFVGCDQAK